MSDVIAVLNDHWRVIKAPKGWRPQWVLQAKKGSAGRKNTGWVGSAYCATQRALRRNILERCGECDPIALRKIDALPEKAGLS